MMKSKLIAFGFFLVFVAFGYAESKSVESRQDPASKVVTIQMQDYRFLPSKISIEPGTTVEWINTGKHEHTVTDDHASWDSDNVRPGQKFSRRFDEKGTFKYVCVPHEELGMTGTIIVK